jgi:hypothetical protein
MYANHPYLAQQLAREYTRDRLRDAAAYRTVRQLRSRTRERSLAEPTAAQVPARRRWALWPARPRTA